MKLSLFLAAGAALVATSSAAAAGTATGTAIDHALNASTTTAAMTTTRRLASGGLFRMRGIDIVGKDLSSEPGAYVEYCFSRCVALAANPGAVCTGVTWSNANGGTCWFKATDATTTPTTPNAAADSIFDRRDATSATIWSGTRDNADIAGNDLSHTNRGSIDGCKGDCAGLPECYAVTWTNYNGGTCWHKRRASAYENKAGAKSAYVARQIFSLAKP